MDPLHTIGEVVQYIEENHSNTRAFNYFEDGHWKHLSTEQFLFDLKRLTYGLVSLGLKRGDKVGILAQSSPHWNMADFAIIMAGGVSVPLFTKIASESFIYEVAQSNARFLFVQGEEQWEMYEAHRNLFEKVIGLDDPGNIIGAMKFHEVLQQGELLWEKQPRLWEELKSRLNSDDLATIIYTAGSTGMPKGVMLSHLNICHLISGDVFRWKPEEQVYLSILPLAHVFARQINLILLAWGVPIYYLNDLTQLATVCRELRPSLMIVVPRLLEKMYDAMYGKVRAMKKGLARSISSWAFRLAKDPSESLVKNWLLRPIADFLVYSKIRNSLGANWEVILCGGAALDHSLNRFYQRIGLPIYEGWGLTEGSTACVNQPGNSKVGTVGPPLPGVKIQLGENDEILLGGPTVMKGFYRNPDATKAIIDDEGWLHTGDKGRIDSRGRLSIVGRVKEQFKLSSGEYLSPSRIEHMLNQHPLVDISMVIGEKRKYAVCLFFPDFSGFKRLKKELKLEDLTDEELLKVDKVRNELDELLLSVNERINRWERLVKWKFIMDTPSIEKGELTPTLKLKRNAILEKYKDVIDAIYDGEEKL
jgi:long-chain acyl-CoA synthetase